VGIKSRKILRKLTLPKQQKKSLVNKSNDVSKAGGGGNWLRKAQEQMLDFSKQQAESTLVSTFYRKCFECSKQDNGMHDIYNEDACAFAYAYKDAMVSDTFDRWHALMVIICSTNIWYNIVGYSKARWQDIFT
jgi:hypothetical protein